jgi:beta-lactamase regulating signal transducer with metallopeptidase domain
MTSAGRLYRLTAVLGAIAVAAVGLGAVLAVQAAQFHLVSSGVLADGCRSLTFGDVTAPGLLALALIAAGWVVGFRAAKAVARELRAARELRRALRVVGRERRDGISFTLVEDRVPQAFCTGFLRPWICVSTGALHALTAPELRAVLVHERHHRRWRDPLRLMLLRVLEHALPFLPGLPRIAQRYAALAEVAADEAALARTGDRRSLARALLVFGVREQSAGAVGIAPERVDLLMGRRPGWELPVGVLAAFVLAVAALAGVMLVANLLLLGHHVDLPLLPTRGC